MPNELKSFIRTHPSLRILLPFGLGIVSQSFVTEIKNFEIYLILLLIGLALLFLLQKSIVAHSLVLYILVFFLGLIHAQKEVETPLDKLDTYAEFVGEIVQHKKSKFDQLEVVVQYIKSNGSFVSKQFKTILYLKNDKNVLELKAGQWIKFTTKLNSIKESKFPYAFNYAEYLQRKDIYCQGFTKPDEIKLWDSDRPTFKKFLVESRRYLKSIINTYLSNESSRGIAQALLVGDKSELNQDTYKQFSESGAVHVLAVSGLHVGILTQLLIFLSSLLPRFGKRLVKFQFLFVLTGIWAFALVSGASPSVLRASLMFTMLLIAKDFNLLSSTFNILFASALVLLCLDPNQLFELGFQFSYLAVFGILLFYTPLEKSLFIPNKGLRYFWQLTCVSIAAQLWVAPLSIFYFNQFPLQFILSGWVAIPFTTLSLGVGILLFILEFICAPINLLVGPFFEQILSLFCKSIYVLNEIPNALLTDLWIEPYEIILGYVLLLSLGIYFHQKKRIWVYIFLSTLLFWNGASLLKTFKSKQKVAFYFYPLKYGAAIDLVHGNEFFEFRSAAYDKKSVEYLTKRFRLSIGNPDGVVLNFRDTLKSEKLHYKKGEFLYYDDSSKILWIKKDTDLSDVDTHEVEYVFVEEFPEDINVVQKIKSNIWIISKTKIAERIINHISISQKTQIHDLESKGYFRIKF